MKNIECEISNLKENLWWFDAYDKLISSWEQLFFVNFLPSGKRRWYKKYKDKFRTKDTYVAGTNCFKVDFDIRKNVQKSEWRIISTDELMSYIPTLENGLLSNELLSSYSAIIFSGNWVHIYWLWEITEINSSLYYWAATKILDLISNIFKDTPALEPDRSCTNISHLFRLPWSVNKKTDYWLPPQQVNVIKLNDNISPLVSMLPELWEQFNKEEKPLIQEWLKKLNEQSYLKDEYFKKNNLTCAWHSLYEAINCDLDIRKLVCEFTWWTLASNKINFISQNNGWFTGAYVLPELNVLVRRGSPHIDGTWKVQSPYAFILLNITHWDKKAAFEWAKSRYPNLRWVKTQFRFYNDIKYNADR